MSIPAMKIVFDFIPAQPLDPVNLTPELYVRIRVQGVPDELTFSERISEEALLTDGVFDICWKQMGKIIKDRLERVNRK